MQTVILTGLRKSSSKMAAVQLQPRNSERHRRHPFSYIKQKIANFKHSTESDNLTPKSKIGGSKVKKATNGRDMGNSPYLAAPYLNDAVHHSDTVLSRSSRPRRNLSDPSIASGGRMSHEYSELTVSKAPTISTNGETLPSENGFSSNATSTGITQGSTGIRGSLGGGEGSTFSSPAPSVHSLSTTLTTIQSGAPSTLLGYGLGGAGQNNHHHHHHHHHPNNNINQQNHDQTQPNSTYFIHQFPTTPASAVPAHLAPHLGPTTYNLATANNVLTDDASTRTLASSTRHKRRTSADTNASVRAMAPSSVFGASRESLPLSHFSIPLDQVSTTASSTASTSTIPSSAAPTGVAGIPSSAPMTQALVNSGNIPSSTSIYTAQGRMQSGSVTATAPAAAERASLYSPRGDRDRDRGAERERVETQPPSSAVHSERNSMYHGAGADAASMRSARSGNVVPRARNDSLTGLVVAGRASRRSSTKGEGSVAAATATTAAAEAGGAAKEGMKEGG